MVIRGLIFRMQATFILFALSCPELTFILRKDNLWLQKSKNLPTPRKVTDCGGLSIGSWGGLLHGPKFPSVLTHNGVLCIIWSLIKRFDRFTRPRRQGSQVWLSFSYENSRGCFI